MSHIKDQKGFLKGEEFTIYDNFTEKFDIAWKNISPARI